MKIVGNMIELHRPIATTLHIASAPALAMVVTKSAIAITPKPHSKLRGAMRRMSADPRKRPIMAPPQ